MTESVLLEIRGVGGATAEEIVGGPVTQTSGDELAGFYRPDDSRPQATEAYEWGRLTSGSRTSAVWWVLFPFTLINVAGWMFRPSTAELNQSDENVRSSLWWSRLLIVGGGLAITAAYVMWTTTLTTEMVAFGCRERPGCVNRWYLAPLSFFGPDNNVWLATCGVGLAAILILGLFLFILRTQDKLEGYETSSTRRLLGVAANRTTSRLRRNTTLEDPAFWYKWAEHRRLFRWHLALTMALLGTAAGHAVETAGWSTPSANAWPAILGVSAVVVAMLWALTGPERFRETGRVGETNSQDLSSRIGWFAAHLLLGVVGAAIGWALTALWRNDDSGFGFLTAVRALSVVLYIAAGLMVAVLAVRKWSSDVPTTWPTTLMPGFAAALAVIITGSGFAAVANLLGRFLLGADWVGANGFDIVIVDVFVLSLLITGIVVAVLLLRSDKPTASVIEDHFGAGPPEAMSDRERGWVDTVARARVIAALPHDADYLLAALTVVMLILNLGQAAAGGFDLSPGPGGAFASPLFGIQGLAFFHSIAATATVLYLFPGIQLIRAMSRSRDSRRQLGKVWDVLSFWPRRFHPLAAPCYAERAVPEFRNRIRDHLISGRGVVVSAHSQGTVIAFAALLQIAAENDPLDIAISDLVNDTTNSEVVQDATAPSDRVTFNDLDVIVQRSLEAKGLEPVGEVPPAAATLNRTGLVTFGSPLSSLYGPYFPWHFGTPGRLQGLRDRLADLDTAGRAWRNLWRPTDYIGQKVFIAPGGVLTPPVDAADIRVLEAAQPLFPYQSHSDYEREPQVREAIAAMVSGIEAL